MPLPACNSIRKVLLVTLLLIASCATNKSWVKDGASWEETEKDRRECTYEGEKYGPLQKGSGGLIYEAYMMADIAKKCMISRGYRLVENP